MKKLLILSLLLLTGCAATFPTTPVLDSFNRSNGAPSGWTGAAFGDANGITINTNAATSGAAAFGAAFYNVNTYKNAVNGVEAFYTISTLPGSAKTARIVICDTSTCASSQNAYYLILTPSSSNWDMEKLVAGAGTQLGVQFSQAISAGDRVGLSVVENAGTNTITSWICPAAGTCTVAGTRTDTSNLSKKWSIGVELEDNTVRIDNFGGGTVGDNGKGFLGA